MLNKDVSGDILTEFFWNMLEIKYLFIETRDMMNRVYCI